MNNTDIWFIKLTNYTTKAKCPICEKRTEVVVDETDVAVVILEHLPTCEHFNLNVDSSKYKRYPLDENDLIKIKKLFENGKTINGDSYEECQRRNGLPI